MAKDLEINLQAAAVEFANSVKHLRIENGVLFANSILRWYASDFDAVGGVKAYMQSLTDIKLRPDADDLDARIETDFPDQTQFRYDWTLNDVKNRIAATMAAPPVKMHEATARKSADATDILRTALGEWFSFYNGYDPQFTWWMGMPYKHAEKALQVLAADTQTPPELKQAIKESAEKKVRELKK